MTTVTIPEREIPVHAEVDVVVAGAGVAGVCAAVAAARAGARTILVERHAFPGGVATAGLMCSVSNYFITRDGVHVTNGLAKEFIERVVAEGGAMPDWARPGQPQIPNDPEVVKRVMISMLREAGVQSLYGVFVSQASLNGAAVDALICEAKGGAFAVRAKQFVDATGDLDLFALADGPFVAADGFSTLLFRMADVDIDAVIDWFESNPDSYSETADIPTSLQDTIANWRRHGVFHLPHYAGRQIAVIREAIKQGELPDSFGQHARELWAMGMFSCRANRGTVLVNSCAFKGDEFDIVRKSQCEEEGRLVAQVLADFLVRRFPGFGSAHLIETATEIGVRLTRRLVGLHTLTQDEYRTARRFDDVIGCTTEIDRAIEPAGRYAQGGEIPFSCLVADSPANVICGSGKSASTDPRGLLRGQVPCMVVGEAAGTAAGLAAQEGVPVNRLDVRRLQRHLVEGGVLLPARQ